MCMDKYESKWDRVEPGFRERFVYEIGITGNNQNINHLAVYLKRLVFGLKCQEAV